MTNTKNMLALAALAMAGTSFGQVSPSDSKDLPGICKLAAESSDYRMVECVYKPGQRVEFPSGPEALVYYETQCSLRQHFPDGSLRDFNGMQGYAGVRYAIGPRSVENLGKSDCRILTFGPK